MNNYANVGIVIMLLVAGRVSASEPTCTQLFGVSGRNESDFIKALECLEKKQRLPKGMVSAFDSPTCPQEWSRFRPSEGRFIMSAGNNNGGNHDENGRRLTSRSYLNNGGEEKHVLTISEIASHNHTFNGSSERAGGWGGSVTYNVGVGDQNGQWSYTPSGTISHTGGGAAHNNLPPYLVLTFCVKD